VLAKRDRQTQESIPLPWEDGYLSIYRRSMAGISCLRPREFHKPHHTTPVGGQHYGGIPAGML
jgi:hypothetical protein